MPLWLEILIQVVETALQVLIKNKPAVDAPQEVLDQHALHVAKVQSALDTLKA